MSFAAETPLSAADIYKLISEGDGTNQLSTAQVSVYEIGKKLQDQRDLLESLKKQIAKVWEGAAVDSAVNTISGALETLIVDVDSLAKSDTSVGAQMEAYSRIANTVVDVPNQPPPLTEFDIQQATHGEAGAYKLKVQAWERQCQINVDAFNTYCSSSVQNGQSMPASYAFLDDSPPPLAQQPGNSVSGGGAGSGGFGGAAGKFASANASGTQFSSNVPSVNTSDFSPQITPNNLANPQPATNYPYKPENTYSAGVPHSPNTSTFGNPYTGTPPVSHVDGTGGYGYSGGAAVGGSARNTGNYGGSVGGPAQQPGKNGRITGATPHPISGETASPPRTPANSSPRTSPHSAMPFGGMGGAGRPDDENTHRRPDFLLYPDPDELFGYQGIAVEPVIGYVPPSPKSN